MKRSTLLLSAVILLLILGIGYRFWPAATPEAPPVTGMAQQGPEAVGPGGAYLRGAHWFGEGWAVNFWNTRLLDRAAEDFAALRADGFNTVVLVVPWPGFVAAPNDGAIDPERAQRLGALIDLADEAGLNVVLRIGYAWDSSVDMAGRWLMDLWLREGVRQAWLDHIAGLWDIVKDRPNVRFAFLSWEDLWAIEGIGEADLDERLSMAQRTGFRHWLRQYSTLEEVSSRYGQTFTAFNQVPVPRRMEPAFGLFFDFIDDSWINRFFKPAQAVFPTLSMEIRIDSDPVWNAPGDLAYWHSHELAWDLPGAPWTTVYWAPAMGGENDGGTISPERAAERLAHLMNRLRAVTGDRPIFIDQFLVEDFTPGFEMNERLDRDAVDEFLEVARPVLESLTHGYALWTWRDYAHDAVASPDFSALEGNWEGARADDDAAPGYTFLTGERLQRSFGIHEFHAPGGPENAALCVTAVIDGDTAPDLRVIADGLARRTELDVSGPGEACVDLDVNPLTTVALEALSDLELLSVRFSGFVQPTGIRDIDGQRKPIATAWIELNEALDYPEPAPFDAFDDGWMGKTLATSLPAPRGDTPVQLRFKTHLPDDWPHTPTLVVRVNDARIGSVPCTGDTQHALDLDRSVFTAGRQKVTLTVDRTHRPQGDERRLGCLVQELALERAE